MPLGVHSLLCAEVKLGLHYYGNVPQQSWHGATLDKKLWEVIYTQTGVTLLGLCNVSEQVWCDA
jgi:hypothetical protein